MYEKLCDQITQIQGVDISYVFRDRGYKYILLYEEDEYIDVMKNILANDVCEIIMISLKSEINYNTYTGILIYVNEEIHENFAKNNPLVICKSFQYILNRTYECKRCNLYRRESIASRIKVKNKVFIFSFPMLADIVNRTEEEQLLYDNMRDTFREDTLRSELELYKKIFYRDDSIEEINSIIPRIPIIREPNGYQSLKDYESKNYNIIAGRRVTTDAPFKYKARIYLFGKSQVVGFGNEDSDTLASCM